MPLLALPVSAIPEACTTPPPKRSQRAVVFAAEPELAAAASPARAPATPPAPAEPPTEPPAEPPVEPPTEPPAEPPAAASAATMDTDEITVTMAPATFDSMTLRELKAMCAARGLSEKGKKSDLVARLGESSVPE